MSVPVHPIAALKAALLGAAIHDVPPRGALPPYLAFGEALARENGTVERDGAILELDLVAVTTERGSEAALAIASAVATALGGNLPALEEHRLVALDIRRTATRHDPATSLTRATLRLSAFTEPL
jgi:Protein of unknown function (DUF3168)